MLQAVFAGRRRILGADDSDTLATTSSLDNLRSQMRHSQPPKPPKPAAQTLPVGIRLLVQRLVAKPEHNGKRARVLSFDKRGGQYTIALDEGKELSLKPECVARAGCAAVGCALEEASSACGRCASVRSCSRSRVPSRGLEGAQARVRASPSASGRRRRR